MHHARTSTAGLWLRLFDAGSSSVALLIALTAVSAHAQQPGQSPRRDSVPSLPAVIVTATRGSTSLLRAPLAITTVAAADLRSTSGFGLDEALKYAPGVLAQSRYGTSDVRITIRGFGARGAGDRSNAGTSRGIRILIDGIPETEPDGRTSFDQVDLASTEAIEVIRSNASAVWGNAAGGVINLLTVPSSATPVLDVQPIYGSFGLARYAVRASAPVGGATLYTNFTNSTFDGWRAHSDARRVLLNAGVVGAVGTSTRVGLFASGANNLFHIPGPLSQAQVDADPRQANATYATRDERRYNRIVRLGGTIDHDINATTSISSMLFVSPKYLQRSERGTYRDFTRYHVGGNLIGRTSTSFSPTVRSTLTIGADEAYQDGAILFYSLTPQGTRGTTLMDNKGEGANNLGFFAQDELVFGDRLTVTLGARYDRVGYYYRSFLPAPPVRFDSRSFSRITPKVGASWLLSASHSLYANIGGGIEVPAGNETDPTPNAAPALLNPLLDPIRSTTYEVGFKSLGPSTADAPVAVTYDVALYDSEVSNEIIPYNGGRFYLTAGKARRSGAELGVGAWTRFGLFGNLAVTASRNRYVDYVVDSVYLGAPGARADFSGKKIVGVPDIFANAEIGMAVPGYSAFRVKAGLEHVSSYFADDANAVNVRAYSVLNLTAELREPITAANGWGVRGFVTLHNASNAKYIGSAFLNPDRVGGVPLAYEPGMPRSVTISMSLGRLR